MRDLLKQALTDLINIRGEEIFADSTRLFNYLGDVLGDRGVYAGEARRLRNLLHIALTGLKAYTRLKGAPAADVRLTVDNLVSEMESLYDIKKDTAGTVIGCVAELLETGRADRIRETPAAEERQKITIKAVPNGSGYIFSKFSQKSPNGSPLEYFVDSGRGYAEISDIAEYAPGTILELDRDDGEPHNLVINGKTAAKGVLFAAGGKSYFRIERIIGYLNTLK